MFAPDQRSAPSWRDVYAGMKFFKFGLLTRMLRFLPRTPPGAVFGSGGTWRGVGLPHRRFSCPDRFTWRIWI